MLIIFDLDDTLIDTSGSITPTALENALRAMIDSGLRISTFAEALTLLNRINQSAPSSKEALSEFLEVLDGDAALLEVGREKLCGAPIPPDLLVFPLDGAVELLAELAEDHQLALVTMGKFSVQMEKLKKAGIDSTFFSNIIVSEDGNKKKHYKRLQEDRGYSSNEILTCGDRIPIDLAPAKELGFKTVHMKWGRGLISRGRKGDVDFEIHSLKELKDIISHLMTFSAF